MSDLNLPDLPGKQDNKTWNQMMNMAGREFAYEINRDARTFARDGAGRGFSVEAMDVLVQHMVSFIGTRIARHNDALGVMPQQLAIRIRVDLNSAPGEFDESLETKVETIRVGEKPE